MNLELEHDDLIDLGTASVETRGGPVGMDDAQGGLEPVPGTERRVSIKVCARLNAGARNHGLQSCFLNYATIFIGASPAAVPYSSMSPPTAISACPSRPTKHS